MEPPFLPMSLSNPIPNIPNPKPRLASASLPDGRRSFAATLADVDACLPSTRSVKKALVCPDGPPLASRSMFQGKPALIFQKSSWDSLADDLKFALIGKFTFGFPKIDSLRTKFSVFGDEGLTPIDQDDEGNCVSHDDITIVVMHRRSSSLDLEGINKVSNAGAKSTQRQSLWQEIERLNMTGLPWIVGGDFNTLKLIRAKQCLKSWNKSVFGNIFDNVKIMEEEVANRESVFDNDPSDSNRMLMKESYARLARAMSVEEDYWRQKAACRWYTKGERNAKYFHSIVKKRRSKNWISSIFVEGESITNNEEIGKSAASFFQQMFTATDTSPSHQFLNCLDSVINHEDAVALCRPIHLEELKSAVFSIQKESVACPDGFSAGFYQSCWNIISGDLLDACNDFISGSSIPRAFKATSVVLIPKKASPESWSDFRPISLCNVSNKILTKILTMRLNPLIPRIISPSQSGFVPSRNILDNILMAQELAHHIDKPGKWGNAILKLDMAKAYDRVHWKFLYEVLFKLGFPHIFISLIKNVVEDVWFSILVNGATYADDLLIFTKANPLALSLLMDFLTQYQLVSGQLLNHNKSDFICGAKVGNVCIQNCLHVTGFYQKTLPVIYLGAPLFKGRCKSSLFDILLSKVKDKISGWDRLLLSMAGRLLLIRFVLSSMPLYFLQVLHVPKVMINKFHRLFARFLWGSSDSNTKMHWARWTNICFPLEEGGLGLRNLTDINVAFEIKLWWHLRTGCSLWSSFMRKKYLSKEAPLCAPCLSHHSPLWRRLVKIREIAEQNIYWSVGKGDIYFWQDVWLPYGSSRDFCPNYNKRLERVHDYWVNGTWDRRSLSIVLPPNIVNEICNKFINDGNSDMPTWKLSSDGSFTMKSAWNSVRITRSNSFLFKNLWSPSVRPAISLFIWRLLHCWVSVDDVLRRRGSASCGGVVRDSNGKVFAGFSCFLGIATFVYAEVKGVLEGLELCLALNLTHVWVESDSMVALHLIQKPPPVRWEFQDLIL
ncbi:hypothetical protein DH2020_034308 [Rehmannia glutinosa]|uniref:Reverse transcriptase domain-containing protein n=1 Tax=Rehmannia glutinosa TaxID=99300 RepID=A0ABR0VAN7_REHGL